MVVLNNRRLAKTLRHLVTTAKINHKWEYIHDKVGYNFRMPNLNAALGLAQFEKIKFFLKKEISLINILSVLKKLMELKYSKNQNLLKVITGYKL